MVNTVSVDEAEVERFGVGSEPTGEVGDRGPNLVLPPT
jgi:hypothetical protein